MLNSFCRIATNLIGPRRARFAFAVWFACLLLAGLPWEDFAPYANWGRVSWVPFPVEHRRLDDILNFLFYVPFGLFGVTWGWSRYRVAGYAALLSLATELSQVFGITRYPSTTDLVTNTAGAVVGSIVWSAVEACAQRLSKDHLGCRGDRIARPDGSVEGRS